MHYFVSFVLYKKIIEVLFALRLIENISNALQYLNKKRRKTIRNILSYRKRNGCTIFLNRNAVQLAYLYLDDLETWRRQCSYSTHCLLLSLSLFLLFVDYLVDRKNTFHSIWCKQLFFVCFLFDSFSLNDRDWENFVTQLFSSNFQCQHHTEYSFFLFIVESSGSGRK